MNATAFAPRPPPTRVITSLGMPWWAPAIERERERERERELAGGRGENGFRFLIGEGIGGAVPDGRSRTRT